MQRIPPAALVLGFLGLIPFIWAALLVLEISEGVNTPLPAILGGDGQLIMIRYGGIILTFMSGVLWGFAAQATGGQAAAAYSLSVIPALWWFFMPGSGPVSALSNLAIGYVALLILDYAFYRWELAPRWWMSLRIQLTILVLICLGIGAFA